MRLWSFNWQVHIMYPPNCYGFTALNSSPRGNELCVSILLVYRNVTQLQHDWQLGNGAKQRDDEDSCMSSRSEDVVAIKATVWVIQTSLSIDPVHSWITTLKTYFANLIYHCMSQYLYSSSPHENKILSSLLVPTCHDKLCLPWKKMGPISRRLTLAH